MSSGAIDNDLALMEDTARAAGALARRYFGTSYAAWDKSPGNPVSEADLAVDRLICEKLRGARPDYGWLSEESHDSLDRLTARRVWVVDPIDGTRAFIKGKPEYVISIALVEGGRAILGCVYDPSADALYAAQLGAGAWRDGIAIRASNCSQLAGARMLAAADILTSRVWPEAWPEMVVAKPNSLALRLVLVAEGAYDAAFTIRRKSDWDIAAAGLIVTEAGGRFTDHRGETLVFNCAQPHHPTLIASTPGLHDELVRRVSAGHAERQRLKSAAGKIKS